MKERDTMMLRVKITTHDTVMRLAKNRNMTAVQYMEQKFPAKVSPDE